MSEVNEAYKTALVALLRLWSVSEGADICDRCGETIWPEIELVRCDFCVGKHGAPSKEAIQAAYEKHKERIHRVEREERAAEQEVLDEQFVDEEE